MRKLFNLLACLVLLTAGLATPDAQAQRLFTLTPQNGVASGIDTVTNTATKVQTVRIDGYQDQVAIQVQLDKISGTAAGKVYLLGSLDGTNYLRAGGADSLVVTNVASQGKIFTVTPSQYLYYRTSYTGSGTMAVKIISKALYRKR